MKIFKKIPFYTFLLTVFFCLHSAVQDAGAVTPGDILSAGVPIFIFIVLLFAGFFYLAAKKDLLFTGFVTFFFSAWYLFFGVIKDMVQHIPLLNSYLFVLPVLIAATASSAYFLRKKTALLRKLTFFLNMLLIAWCLFDTVAIIRIHLAQNHEFSPADTFNYAAVREKPDLYFLLFDGYAGYPSLRDSFGFSNEQLRSGLEKSGFQVIPSSSDYAITPLSMSSIFNMEYASPLDNSIFSMAAVRQDILRVKHAALFSIFEKMGYTVHNFSIFDVGNEPGLGGDIYFPLHTRLVTAKIFHYRFLRDIAPRLISPEHPSEFGKRMLWGDLPHYNAHVEEKLLEHIRLRMPGPQFVYAHFLMPHYPYFLDSNGIAVPDSILLDNRPNAVRDKVLYLSYLKYCNKKIEEYVTDITREHPAAGIIIMSDHGFRGYHAPQLPFEPAYLDNLCEVRMPGKQNGWPARKTTAVNFFRRFFNTYYGQSYPILNEVEVSNTKQR